MDFQRNRRINGASNNRRNNRQTGGGRPRRSNPGVSNTRNRGSPSFGTSLSVIPSLDRPAYGGQVITTDILLGATSLLSTSALGTIASTLTLGNLNLNVNVPSFTIKWGNMYDEYAIVGIDIKIIPVNNSTSGGLTAFWYDEKSAVVPAFADTQTRTVRYIQNAFTGQKQFMMKWRARDLADLVFTPITSDTTPVFFKVFTNSANFAAAPSQALFVLHQVYHVTFRGFRT